VVTFVLVTSCLAVGQCFVHLVASIDDGLHIPNEKRLGFGFFVFLRQ
jgi:hypothetical protein